MSKFDYSRRKSLKTIGAAVLTIPMANLIGCATDDTMEDSSSTSSTSSSTSSSSSSSSSSSPGSSTTTASGYEEASTTLTSSVDWASGDTDLITVDYPDDSLFDGLTVCNLSLDNVTTEGPCYLGVATGEDISEGQTGLPMQLCLQLVDSACNPLDGYLIEVWHCDRSGVYSGDTTQSDDSSSFAGSFCTGGDSAASNSVWFRGELVTDSNGRVNFKSCFPGWYSGRTIHIHYRVRLTNGGSDYLVSQFCFDDDFAEEICTSHDQYSSRGVQNTPLSGGSDTVFPSSGYDEYMLNIAQNSDGTLLAYKKIMITA